MLDKLKKIFKRYYKRNLDNKKPFGIQRRKSREFSYQAIYDYIFSTDNLGKIKNYILIFSVLSVSYILGRSSALIMSSLVKNASSKFNATPTIQRKKYAIISNKDLFKAKGVALETNTQKSPVTNKRRQPSVCNQKETMKKSQLPIKLLHTTVLLNSAKSLSVLKVASQEPSSFRKHDIIKGYGRLDYIKAFEIGIKNTRSGNCEKITLKNSDYLSGPPIKVLSPKEGHKYIAKYNGIENIGNSFKIKKSIRDDLLKNMNTLLTQARAIPLANPDGTMCYKMVEIEAGSFFSKVNIQNNDIVCGLNGKKFKNLNQIMNMFSKIKTIDNFEISLKRAGQQKNYDYTFTE